MSAVKRALRVVVSAVIAGLLLVGLTAAVAGASELAGDPPLTSLVQSSNLADPPPVWDPILQGWRCQSPDRPDRGLGLCVGASGSHRCYWCGHGVPIPNGPYGQ